MHNSYLYRVKHIQPLVGQTSQIFLKAINDSGLDFAAGQYVNILHQDQSVSPLSIACAPNNKNELEFHLFHPLQHQPAQDLLRMAVQEKAWTIMGPFGNCTDHSLSKENPVIFIARGTGFAPVKAIIEALSQSTHPLMHFYWSVPDRGNFYLENLLAEWTANIAGFKFTPIFADKDAASPDSLCEKILLDHQKDISSCQIYVSGSLPFVQAVYWALQPFGLQREFFYSDVFS